MVYFLGAILWIIISIVLIVKFFQMANDIRVLKSHFVPSSTAVNNNIVHINKDEVVKGIIRKNGGINYTLINGCVEYSDGKTGFIRCCDDDTYKVDEIADVSFYDIYNAAEALYDHLSSNNK